MTVPTVTHKTILIVEDEPDISSFVAMFLESEGYQVEAARNGEEALYKMRHDLPDVVLLDLMLPKVDGWQFIRECRDDPHICGIPIIVVTAAYNAVRSPELEGLAVLAKPIDLDLLTRALEDALSWPEGEASTVH